MQGAFYDKAQQTRKAFTFLEEWAGENPLQLFANSVPLGLRLRIPCGMTIRIYGRPSLRTNTPGTKLYHRRFAAKLQLLCPRAALGAVIEPYSGKDEEQNGRKQRDIAEGSLRGDPQHPVEVRPRR